MNHSPGDVSSCARPVSSGPAAEESVGLATAAGAAVPVDFARLGSERARGYSADEGTLQRSKSRRSHPYRPHADGELHVPGTAGRAHWCTPMLGGLEMPGSRSTRRHVLLAPR